MLRLYSVGDGYKMSTTHWWNNMNIETQKFSGKTPFQCHCFYHRSHNECRGTEPGSQEWESGPLFTWAVYQSHAIKLYWKIGQMFTFVSKRNWANFYSKCRVGNLSFSACCMTIVNIIWTEKDKIMKWHLWETKQNASLMFVDPCIVVQKKKKSNKMQKCIKILLFHIHIKLNMFGATHHPSSGA